MTKSLTELSLHITEELYREIPCLSQSSIARYEKGGFSVIPHLFDTQESDSLLFGSIVDTLITEGMNKFKEKFIVADFTIPTDSIKNVLDIILNECSEDTLDNVDDGTILRICNECEYNSRLKDETRITKIRNEGTQYYNTIKATGNRKIVSNEMYQDALNTVGALRESPLTNKYLGTSSGETEFLYQQKFKTTLEGLEVKCMFDLLVVMHDKKIIIPIDLKTSSFPEYDFPKRYLENRYDIQSRLYYRILKDIVSQDEYFKDFEILPFRFIVVNKNTRIPLVFKDEKCQEEGDIVLTFTSGRNFTLRNPITIGKELQEYLNEPKCVPNGINLNQSNNIYERLQLL